MFDDQIIRLRRGFKTADELAEELEAMFGDNTDPVMLGSSVSFQVNPEAPVAPIDLGHIPDTGTPIFRGTNSGGETIIFNLNPSTGVVPPVTPGGGAGGSATPSASSAMPGNLIAYNGSNSYVVTVYPNGTSRAGQTVTVTQLEGNASFPHRTDGTTWAIVTRGADGTYSMNRSVWG